MARLCLSLASLLAGATAVLAQGQAQTEITALAFTPDGKTLISASMDGFIRYHRAATGKERLRVQAHKHGVYSLGLSADGKLFASAGADRKVRLWDTAKVKEIQTLEGHEKEVFAVAVAPDGKRVASGGADGTIRIWDPVSGRQLHLLKGHESKVTAVVFSPDGKLLASGGIVPAEVGGFSGSTQADRVRLWDPISGKEIRRLEQRGQVLAFAPGTGLLASAGMYLNFIPQGNGLRLDGGSAIAFWDPIRQKERPAIKEFWHAITFSADGRFLASGWGTRLHMGGIVISHQSRHRGIHLWELASAKDVRTFNVPDGDANVLAISPDGMRLAAGQGDGKVRMYDLSPPGWKAERSAKPSLDELKRWWTALAGADAGAAYEAVWELTATGNQAVAFFRENLRIAEPPSVPVRKLIADLDSGQFKTREAASRELAKLGPAAQTELRQARNGKLSAEARQRVEALLANLDNQTLSAEDRQHDRALMVLERQATPAARKLLDTLAKGAAGSRRTEGARAALRRLDRRNPQP